MEKQLISLVLKFVLGAVLVAVGIIAAFAGGFCRQHPAATCSFRQDVVDTQGRIYTEYYCSCGDTVYVPR